MKKIVLMLFLSVTTTQLLCNKPTEQKLTVDNLTGAAFYGNFVIVKKALDAGIDPNATDRFGGIALQRALQNDYLDEDLLSLKIKQRQKKIISLLLKRGAHPNNNGTSYSKLQLPLSLAVRKNLVTITSLLLDYGATPQEDDWEFYTACAKGFKEIMQLFLMRSITDTKAKRLALNSGLRITSGNFQPSTCSLLLELGADISDPDTDGFSSFHWLADKKAESPEELEKARALFTVLINASKKKAFAQSELKQWLKERENA